MTQITYTPLTAADLGDEEAFNSRFGLIVSKLNTGLDTDNLLANAATRAKIGQSAVTSAKIDNAFTWTTPTFTAGWTNWTDATFDGPRYYKDPRGVVRFRGLIYRASGTSNTMFNLPAGYRPQKRLIFMVSANNNGTRVDVDPNGNVEWITGQAQNNWHSLANISFRAVQ